MALIRGRAGLPEFSDEAVADPALRDLGARLVFRDAPAMSVDAIEVRIDFADGASLHRKVATPRGSLARPLEDREIEQKLRDLARHGQVEIDVDRLIDSVWSWRLPPTLPCQCACRPRFDSNTSRRRQE